MNDTQRTYALPRRARFLTLAASAVVLLAACSTGGASPSAGGATTEPGGTTAPTTEGEALTGTVTIDGSSTVYPITEAAAEDFQLANPGVTVPVAFSGTGGGFKKFCIGETDVNDASRPIKPDDEGEGVACAANNIEWVELQVAIDGLTVVVNPDNDWATCLTVAELNKIYGPESSADLLWSDVRAGFPAEKVNRYMAGADSGTFDYFTEAINGEVDASTSHGVQSEDDNTLVIGVAGDKNAIGYFGYSYYIVNADKLKALAVDGGEGCIEPNETTINDGSYSPLSRPLFIYPDVGKARERPELAAFVRYYLENSKELSTDPTVGYIAVPDGVFQAELAEWEAALQ
jgi:phosphate transport system substrate-binding protein